MKTISIHSSIAGMAAAALAGVALLLPLHDAEARRDSRGMQHHLRSLAPVARDYRSVGLGTTKIAGGLKATGGGSVKATTTGTNKAPADPGRVVIRDHRRPTCYAPGHCKPARFYFYKGQRYLLRRNGS